LFEFKLQVPPLKAKEEVKEPAKPLVVPTVFKIESKPHEEAQEAPKVEQPKSNPFMTGSNVASNPFIMKPAGSNPFSTTSQTPTPLPTNSSLPTSSYNPFMAKPAEPIKITPIALTAPTPSANSMDVDASPAISFPVTSVQPSGTAPPI
jgi:hypothetical protein